MEAIWLCKTFECDFHIAFNLPTAAEQRGQVQGQRVRVLVEQAVSVVENFNSPLINTVGGETFNPALMTTLDDEEIWFYDNYFNSIRGYPIRVNSFNSNTQAVLTVAPLFAPMGPNRPFTGLFRKVKVDRFFYQAWVDGMSNNGTAIVKARVAPILPTSIIPGSRGILLRMAYRNQKVGKWIEFTPQLVSGANPQAADPVDGLLTWVVGNLKPGCEYAIIVGEPYRPTDFYYYLDNNIPNDPIFINSKSTVYSSSLYSTRFKMPPSQDDCCDIKFGLSSCNAGPIDQTFDGAFKENFDFYLFGGDTIYGDRATTPSQYREIWSELWRSENFTKLLTSVGTYGLPDDHEVTDNWEQRGYWLNPAFIATQEERNAFTYVTTNFPQSVVFFALVGPTNIPPLFPTQRIVDAYNQMDRFLIARPFEQVVDNKRNYLIHWGKLDLIAIDRMPKVNQQNNTVEYHEAQGLYYAQDQIDFLKKSLLESRALVKVVFQSGIYSINPGDPDYYEKVFVEKALSGGFSESVARNVFFKSRIASNGSALAILNQVNELMDFIIQHNIKNVIFLGFGAHTDWVKYYDTERCILEIQVSATGTDNLGSAQQALASQPINNQISLLASNQNNYGEILISPKNKTMNLLIKNGDLLLNELAIKLK